MLGCWLTFSVFALWDADACTSVVSSGRREMPGAAFRRRPDDRRFHPLVVVSGLTSLGNQLM